MVSNDDAYRRQSGETDDDVKATLDLMYELERRNLFAFLVPSVFTPLHDTRMAKEEGVTQTRNLSPLQWQVIMKCWKNNLRPGQYSWWGPSAWRIGSLVMWLTKLRRTNGANFTWPLFMFASLLPEEWMERMGKIYVGKPLKIKEPEGTARIHSPQLLEVFYAKTAAISPKAGRDLRPGRRNSRLSLGDRDDGNGLITTSIPFQNATYPRILFAASSVSG